MCAGTETGQCITDAQVEGGRQPCGWTTCLMMVKPKWVRREFSWGKQPQASGESGWGEKGIYISVGRCRGGGEDQHKVLDPE